MKKQFFINTKNEEIRCCFKKIFICLAFVVFITTIFISVNFAIPSKPYTPPKGSPERKAIIDALRNALKVLELENIVFVVKYLMVKNGWAWIETCPQSPDGVNKYEPVDALLYKENGKWTVKQIRPCCGECEEDPECADIKKYYKKLMREFPSVPNDIFPR